MSVAELKHMNNIVSDEHFYELKCIKIPAFGGASILTEPSAPSIDEDID